MQPTELQFEAIAAKLEACLTCHPDNADATGLAVMGIALLVRKVISNNVFSDVRAFHAKMGIIAQKSIHLSAGAQKFRDNFLEEEYNEYRKAVKEKDLEAQFDALLDIIYICAGTIALHNWDGEEGWRRVQRSNMAKEPQPFPTTRSRNTGQIDVIKPNGWTKPVFTDLVFKSHFEEKTLE